MPKIFSSDFFKRTLKAHSWLGLVVGAAMYLVCLSGTLVVFQEELSRWEQPEVEEFTQFDPIRVSDSFNTWFEGPDRITPHLWVILPTDAMPRLRFASETDSWFLNEDGSIGPEERNSWIEMVVDLHYYLHLPKSWGMIFVSALGAMLVALILSGFLAHPKIVRDAFKLRLGGSRQLEQTDIHNRLSVWGAPFHLMIGMTGAYFGFALIILGLYAFFYADNDSARIVEDVFGSEPELTQPLGGVAIDTALANMASIAPSQEPIMVTVHDAGTKGRFIEILATVEGRLIYSENYVFDANGDYLSKRGFSDGEAGKQIIYAFYRLHFGRFGGFGIKVIYGVLGMALTIISATGISIWLAKRRARSWLDDLWAGTVWGVPVALTLSAFSTVVLSGPAFLSFWATYLLLIMYSLWRRDDLRARRDLQWGGAVTLVFLVAAYFLVLPFSLTAVLIGLTLLISAFCLGFVAVVNSRRLTYA